MKQYLCDGPTCSKVAVHPYAGWVTVEILDRRPQLRIPLQFCSATCLSEHAAVLTANAAPASAAPRP